MLVCVGANGVSAQQQTAYEKKKAELIVQVWEKWGQRTAALLNNTVSDKSDEELFALAKDAKIAAALTGGANSPYSAIIWYSERIKQAEKLKTAVDFKREKDVKEKKEREAYERTDAGSIKKSIKVSFEKWNQKGEFEKETDFDLRLKNKSQDTFFQICSEQIRSRVGNNNYDLEKELSIYNSEKELFTVTFKRNGVKWQNTIKIPIANAANFKNNWSELECKIDDYDWSFVENSLCPTLVTLVNRADNSKYGFPLLLKNQSEISYSFNEFEIANPYLQTVVFKYSEAKQIINKQESEKEQLDSLELEKYNERLDSMFKDFNRQLIQNPYNIGGKVMMNYNKIEKNENNSTIEDDRSKRESLFDNRVNSMKKNFYVLNENFQSELQSKNPSEYCRIYFLQNPDKKTDADKMYLECRCNYPLRENFDIKFITGSIHNCNCRDYEYRKDGNLFTSKNEFDSFYDKGDDFLQNEISIRKLKLEEETLISELKSNVSTIEALDFKDLYGKINMGGRVEKVVSSSLTDLNMPNNTNKEDWAKYYVQKISIYKVKPYYSKVVDYIIEVNKKLSKEWTKSGESFSTKVEFYEAYISGSYKALLKEKKLK
jgi:hypothetical protein